MPFIIVNDGPDAARRFCVYTETAHGSGKKQGRPHGCHPTMEQARKQQAALYVHVPEARKEAGMEPEATEALCSQTSRGDYMVTLGPAVKAMGGGKVSGYLVQWGNEATKDSEGEWFTAETDFDTEFPARASVYYHHGQDPAVGRQRLTHGKMEPDDFGVRIDAQLDLRNPRQAAIYRRVERGEMGWSSGSLPHITIPPRENPGGPILQWPLGHDASLTRIPADRRNLAVAMKSMLLPPVEEPLEEIAVRGESLADNTDRWLDDGMSLAAGYGDVAAKAGRKLSASRRARLVEMRQMIDDLLSETAPQDAAAAEESTPAPGMGAGAHEVGGDGQERTAGGIPVASLPDVNDLYAALVRQEDRGLSSIGRLV